MIGQPDKNPIAKYNVVHKINKLSYCQAAVDLDDLASYVLGAVA